MRSVVITTTSGLDSTVLLYRNALQGREVRPFFVDYGQQAASTNIALVRRHIENLRERGGNVHYLFVHKFAFPAWMIRSNHLFQDGYCPHDTSTEHSSQDEVAREKLGWINCRNLFIHAFAAAYAARHDAMLVTGHHASEPDSEVNAPKISDVSIEFVGLLEECLTHSLDRKVLWAVPLYSEGMTKEDILAEAAALQVPLDLTYSCDYFPPCGGCPACNIVKELGYTQWQPK